MAQFKIAILSGILFAAIYPICFLFSRILPLKEKYHKYHLRIVNFVTGAAGIAALCMDLSLRTKLLILIWKACYFVISRHCWKKKYPDLALLIVPSLIGLTVFVQAQGEWFDGGFSSLGIELAAGTIFSSAVFLLSKDKVYRSAHQIRKQKKQLKNKSL